MNRRPLKVEEPVAAYVAEKSPAQKPAVPVSKSDAPQIRYADAAAAQKAMDKVFKTHDELFRRLAQ